MLIFSHRGYHKKHRENTIEAFSSSLNYRIDGIETDIRRTADNIPILFHDRLAPCNRLVAELTHAELNHAVGFSVPTLSEALSKWNHIIWNLEIKTPNAVESTLEVLDRYRSSHRFLVTSFFHEILSKIADSLDIQCGAIISHNSIDLKELLRQLQGLDKRINTIVLPVEFLSNDTISIAHNQGFKIFVYDVEISDDFIKCNKLMADAIITNRPDLMLI